MVVKFTPDGRVDMVFGRKQEASDEGTGPLKHPDPPLPAENGKFRQVTDVAWDAAGNTYISDGYINSRVAKVDKDGNWLKSWGDRGAGPGQFHTPHSIAVDASGQVYVADRGNRRIQVFDGDGNFLRQFTIDVPVPPDAQPAIGNKPGEAEIAAGTFAPGSPWAICISPRTETRSVQRRRLSRPHLQADARRQAIGRARPVRQTVETVRLDSPDGVPGGKRALRRRTPELARPEARARGVVAAEALASSLAPLVSAIRRGVSQHPVGASALDAFNALSPSIQPFCPVRRHALEYSPVGREAEVAPRFDCQTNVNPSARSSPDDSPRSPRRQTRSASAPRWKARGSEWSPRRRCAAPRRRRKTPRTPSWRRVPLRLRRRQQFPNSFRRRG